MDELNSARRKAEDDARRSQFDESMLNLFRRPEAKSPELAKAVADLEAALVAPAPGQLEILRSSTWHTDGTRLDDYHGYAVIPVFTRPPTAGEGPRIPIPGQTLFNQLAEREDYDAIAVNPSGWVGNKGRDGLFGMMLGPGFARGIADGWDARPGAGPLEARSMDELELWLELREFPIEGRSVLQDGSQWVATWLSSEVWSIVETATDPNHSPRRTEKVRFTIGQTGGPCILCAGLLAQRIVTGVARIPGRWALKSKRDKDRAARLALWIRDLELLLPPGADRLPRNSVLTAAGARRLREMPAIAGRPWIERTRKFLEAAAESRLPFGL